MFALFKKEITSFLSSLSGFVVIIVFLIANGLFLWVFKGNLNIMDNGYATLEALFMLAPWIFLFLIPAITMRTFAEEKKSRTMELLLSRPLSDMQIVLAKYLAAMVSGSIINPAHFDLFLFGRPSQQSPWKHRFRRHMGLLCRVAFPGRHLRSHRSICFLTY